MNLLFSNDNLMPSILRIANGIRILELRIKQNMIIPFNVEG